MSNTDYKELYKKYRPEKWEDIVGQEAVVTSLKNAVRNESIPTAYGFFGSHGCGKALHKNTMIPTPDGFRKMGSLKIGDYVLGSDSRPVKVLNKYCPNDPISYTLGFADDTSVKASAGHLWEIDFFGDKTIFTTQEIYDMMITNVGTLKIDVRTVDNGVHDGYNKIFEKLGFESHELAARFVDVFMSEISDEGRIIFDESDSSYSFSFPSSFPEMDNIVSVMRALGGNVFVENTLSGIEIDWLYIPEEIIDCLGLIERNQVFSKKVVDKKTTRSHFITRIDRNKDKPADYFCISVYAEDELFLCTESFIPTHNTSTARVLAKALNCVNSDDSTGEPCGMCDACLSIEDGTSLDVTYRSMANAGSTDDVRELCRQAMLQPTGKKSIYILDEVHNLSKSAFDALLIPLEDYSMPSLFILCSTAPEKIPATVLSRIQTRNFTPIKNSEMKDFVQGILGNENIEIEEKLVSEIVRRGRGSARDTLTMLEKLISEGDFSDSIQNEFEFARNIVRELCSHQNDLTCTAKTLEIIDNAEKSGDLENVLIQLFKVARAYIINLENKNKVSIGSRKEAFSFLQDLMILSGDAIDKSRKSNGLDVRIYLDYVIISLIRKHPLGN